MVSSIRGRVIRWNQRCLCTDDLTETQIAAVRDFVSLMSFVRTFDRVNISGTRCLIFAREPLLTFGHGLPEPPNRAVPMKR